ncbi:hypothetical protein C3Y91_04660 [Rhizobium sp. UPM1133]|nr:hypothetical protein [Rhizobium ruizarguesonis]
MPTAALGGAGTPASTPSPRALRLEHDAEKCERFSGDIMLSLFNLEQDLDFRPTRPKIILF